MRQSIWHLNCWRSKLWNWWRYVILQASTWTNRQPARMNTCAGCASSSMYSELFTKWKNTDTKSLNFSKPSSLSWNTSEIDKEESEKWFVFPLRTIQPKPQPQPFSACKTSRPCSHMTLLLRQPATRNRLMRFWWKPRRSLMKVSDRASVQNRNLYPGKAGMISTRS